MMEPETIARYQRHIALLGKFASDDPAAFAQAVSLQKLLAETLAKATLELQRQGFSWGDIANELGITRQVAHRKYRRALL